MVAFECNSDDFQRIHKLQVLVSISHGLGYEILTWFITWSFYDFQETSNEKVLVEHLLLKITYRRKNIATLTLPPANCHSSIYFQKCSVCFLAIVSIFVHLFFCFSSLLRLSCFSIFFFILWIILCKILRSNDPFSLIL